MSVSLEQLKPLKRTNLIDLIKQVGHDVSDWSNTKGHAASNPKYCYEWCFYDPAAGYIFNIWHEYVEENNFEIFHAGNMREMINNAKCPDLDSKSRRAASSRVKRAKLFDQFLQEINNLGHSFRVIVQSGNVQAIDTYESAKAETRLLDNQSWHLKSYDVVTGAFVIARGTKPQFLDQFSAPNNLGSENPDKTKVTTSAYQRDPKVREFVLNRANGICENCGKPGFRTSTGIYLETHHIIPLSEGGADTVENVIALCPNDHKMAHYWIARMEMRAKFFTAIL